MAHEPAGNPKYLPLFQRMDDGITGEPIPEQYSPYAQNGMLQPWNPGVQPPMLPPQMGPQMGPQMPMDPISMMAGQQQQQMPGMGMGASAPAPPTVPMGPSPMSVPGMQAGMPPGMQPLPPAPPGPYSGGPIRRLKQFLNNFNQNVDPGQLALAISAALPGVTNPQQGVTNLAALRQQQINAEQTKAMYGYRAEQRQATDEYRKQMQEERLEKRIALAKERLSKFGVFDEFSREYGPIANEEDVTAANDFAALEESRSVVERKLDKHLWESFRMGVAANLAGTEWEGDERAEARTAQVNQRIRDIEYRKKMADQRAEQALDSLIKYRNAISGSLKQDTPFILRMIQTQQDHINDLQDRLKGLRTEKRKLTALDIFDELDDVLNEITLVEIDLKRAFENIRGMEELPEFADTIGVGTGGDYRPPINRGTTAPQQQGQPGQQGQQAPPAKPEPPEWIRLLQQLGEDKD